MNYNASAATTRDARNLCHLRRLAAAGLAGSAAVLRALMRVLICRLALRRKLRPLRRVRSRRIKAVEQSPLASPFSWRAEVLITSDRPGLGRHVERP
jgi:hypothetical protein